jgi:Inosine-uridine preferring nucleoside hydrolase
LRINRRRRLTRRACSGAAGILTLLLVTAALAGCSTPPPMPDRAAGSAPRVIIDTDLSLYWDDATALGMANVLQQQGKVQILGVVSDIPNPMAVAAIDAIDTAYGHSGIPVGAVADSAANTARHGYSDTVARSLPHAIRDSGGVAGAVPLYRRLLAGQPDRSVTLVAIGAYTNLAQLLASPPGQGSRLAGRDLVAAKVKRLVIEDGLFPAGGPAFTNEHLDVAAARQVVGTGGWPTAIAWVDGYDGIETKVGGMLCTVVSPRNPMRIVYEALFGCGPPGDGDWDGPTLLYAVGGQKGIFSVLGQGGRAVINAEGGLSWASGARPGDEVYVHVADQTALNDRINALIDTR